MSEFEPKVVMVIGDYLKQNLILKDMDRLHNEFTGNSSNFGRWEKVQKKYVDMDWTESRFEEFLRLAHDTVEGSIDEISEAYIDILRPEDLSVELITSSFDSSSIGNEPPGQREGFRYRVREDGMINVSFYYLTKSVDISDDLELEELPNQERIPMLIDVEKRLIIVQTTSPSKVQKAKAEMNKKTILEVTTTGNLNQRENQAEEIVRGFIDEFETEEEGGYSNE